MRFRPGTDVALVWGILWHIFENRWEDKEFIRTRVYGMEQIREEVKRWNPEEVERVTGTPGAQLERVARTLVNNRPGTVIWCMGGTQHSNGNNNTRAYSILQLALGNMGWFMGPLGAGLGRRHRLAERPLCHPGQEWQNQTHDERERYPGFPLD